MQGERRPLCVSAAAPGRGQRIWQAHNVSLCCSARGCKGGWRGGEATSRTRKFPNSVPEPGLRLPAAVLPLCSSDCDAPGKSNSPLGARDSPGFDSLVNVRHWEAPLTGGATSESAETTCHSRPGRLLRRADSLRLRGRAEGGGEARAEARGAGRGAPAPSLRQAVCSTSLHRHLLLTECRKLLTIVRPPGAPQTRADWKGVGIKPTFLPNH